MKYSIFDPTGNITALAESEMELNMQLEAAAEIMKRHAEVEQVGFVRLPAGRSAPTEDGEQNTVCAELRMAGGEFCGNASMCAAALYLLRTREPDVLIPGKEEKVLLRVSGAKHTVEVVLKKDAGNSFSAGICMPPVICTESRSFSAAGISGTLPVVRMEGISHILIGEGSAFSSLKNAPEQAEEAVRLWCGELSAEGLGLIFLEPEREEDENVYRLTPLVYIPGGDTLFWENSCASGTAAAGMFLAKRAGRRSEYVFREPAGTLSVRCDPALNEIRLYGKVAFNPAVSYTL